MRGAGAASETIMVAIKKQTKTKRKGNKTWVKGGASPNPKGAPKRGQSWKEIIHEIGEMTPDEARAISAKLFEQVPLHDEVTLKQAVVMRVYASLLFEPQPGLLNAFMERVEGKVAQPIAQMTDAELRQFIADAIGVDVSGIDGSVSPGADTETQ
jgi:hypothetical protein